MKKMKSTIWLILVMILGATAMVSAQAESEPMSEWKERQPAKWETMTDVNLKFGFAEEWETAGGTDSVAGGTADGKIRIQAFISKDKTVEEAIANLQANFDSWCEGLTLTDPEASRETNGLAVKATGGMAKLINGGHEIEVGVDIIEHNGKVMIVAMDGFKEDMHRYSGDIILTQESYQQAD